jgi:hypothetical protein
MPVPNSGYQWTPPPATCPSCRAAAGQAGQYATVICRSCGRSFPDPLYGSTCRVADAAAERGYQMPQGAAAILAYAALSHCDRTATHTTTVPAEIWTTTGYADHVRADMRIRLAESIAAAGHVPVGMPGETLRHQVHVYGGIREATPDEVARHVWDQVEITLTVGVRLAPAIPPPDPPVRD